MTIDKVIENSYFSWFQSFGNLFVESMNLILIVTTILTFIVLFTFAMLFGDTKPGGTPSKKAITYILFFSIIINIFGGMCINKTSDSNTLYKNWKKEYVKPYIESLPDVSYEIQKVEEIQPSKYYSKHIEVGVNIFSSNPDVEKIYRVTYLKDKYLYTHIGPASLRIIDEDKKEINGKYVEKDLGRDLKKGLYKTEIQLPKDYKIKKITAEEAGI